MFICMYTTKCIKKLHRQNKYITWLLYKYVDERSYTNKHKNAYTNINFLCKLLQQKKKATAIQG